MIPLSIWDTVVQQLENLLKIIPSLVGAIAVLLVGWIISKVAEKFVRRVLRSVGADKLAEKINEIEIFYKSNIKFVPSALLSRLVYYILLFIFFIAATDVLGMAAVSDLMSSILNYLPSLISAFMVFIIGILVADFLKNIVKTTCESLGIPAAGMIANVVFYFLLLNIAMITLSQARIDTEFIQDNLSIILAGIVAAFAIGYGLASKSLVANFLASFYNKEKIKVGDTIIIDGVKGEIIEIDNTSITLRAEGRRIIVPLSKLNSDTYEVVEED
jgi:hypothetical protein